MILGLVKLTMNTVTVSGVGGGECVRGGWGTAEPSSEESKFLLLLEKLTGVQSNQVPGRGCVEDSGVHPGGLQF